MNTEIKILLGIVGGIAAGLCVGLLVAPDKGSETRKKIASMADDWTGQWRHLFHDGQQRPVKKRKPYSRHVARPKGRTSHA
jgi:gas vesicle protein